MPKNKFVSPKQSRNKPAPPPSQPGGEKPDINKRSEQFIYEKEIT